MVSFSLTLPTASTGNICTVRCRNNAQAGPFGGCFPVKQTGKNAQTNNAKTIPTKSNIAAVSAQLVQDKKDFADAVAANQNAGTPEAQKADEAVKAMLAPVSSGSFPTQTVSVELGSAATAPANNKNNNNGGNRGNAGGFGNGGFGGANRNNKQQKRDILRALRMGN